MQQVEGQTIADSTFTTYPSVAEHWYYEYDALCRDGGNQIEKMVVATSRLNDVIQSILDNLELCAEWDNGYPKLSIRKSGNEFPIDALSCGEKEILALILNLYLSKDKYDVFAIDEPEVHLNWHLEERLFKHLKDFCSIYEKQVILSTHSRVVFHQDYLRYAQFLYWQNGKIACSKEISEDLRVKIAGEAIENIKLGNFGKPTFFVEDNIHELVIRAIAGKANVEVLISAVNGSQNVISLFKHSKAEGNWRNCYFVIDGDNRGNPHPGEASFVHRDKYCMENYLLDISVCAAISKKTTDEIRSAILKAIRENRAAILQRNRFFEFLFDRLTETDIFDSSLSLLDASKIFRQFVCDIGFTDEKHFVREYVEHCYTAPQLDALPAKLIEIMRREGEGMLVSAQQSPQTGTR